VFRTAFKDSRPPEAGKASAAREAKPVCWRLPGGASLVLAALSLTAIAAQDQAPNRRDVSIVGRDFRFTPDRVEVAQDDLVRVTFKSEGRPYSFAIDAYRIMKRAAADRAIVFEFHADQPGTFPYYCNLTSVAQCKDMRGTLVVRRK
jgi:heme/copper-type cytochrome/quinol oxidase subunit 2